MATTFAEPVRYELPVGEASLPLNPLLGKRLRLRFLARISCIACGRATKKSFNQGYCFPCMRSLPETDACMVRPETCHFAEGTCRDAEWGRTHCIRPHTVYLANSSGLKVGITRGEDPRGRWIDQGARQGLGIRLVDDRLQAGLVEVALKGYVNDRTNWRAMLKGEPEAVDLPAARERLLEQFAAGHPGQVLSGAGLEGGEVVELHYPVLAYPQKIRSHNFDKEPLLEGVLQGIKGQYLIVDQTVINVRKFAGYHVALEHD